MRFSELDGARVGVWGAGREIASFADQLARRLPSAALVVAAFDEPPSAPAREALRAPAARIVTAERARAALEECDVVVRSPGVSVHRPELRELREAGVHVTTATSLWLCEHGGAGVLGVTGTKGKSTTAALAAQLARGAGLEVALAGNIGVPALDLLDGAGADLTVLELSSYQIADLECGPQAALFTNLYREHLDWHGSELDYRADKLRLFALPGVEMGVVNERDEALARLHVFGEPLVRYGTPAGWDTTAAGITRAGELVLAARDLPLRGEHNALNLCGALAALEALAVPLPALPQALEGFQPLAHRLQEVGGDGGITWVDDSISTTPESAIAALASFPDGALVLIAGGQDRGQDYSALARAIAERGASVAAVPTTGPRLLEAARAAGVPPQQLHEAADLAEAVRIARALAEPGAGAVVLLSPAAPSFDHFRDFEERGESFAELARAAGP